MIKIYSWNVNGIRAVVKKGLWKPFIEAEQPDILCLQEIKAKPEQIDLPLGDYSAFWYSAEKPGYSGTAILSKGQAGPSHQRLPQRYHRQVQSDR